MGDTRLQRERMVQRQIAARGVRDHYTLEAMRQVPREEFVAKPLREFAYEDSPLPIEAGQTISQPYIVALMIAEARIRPGERVLEIGAGSGYAAAVMATIAQRVYAIERVPELAALARERFERLGYDNIELRTGDGTRGWPEAAPFDAIVAAAGGPEIPDVLLRQLAPGGRLVMPVGTMRDQQRLVLVTRTGNERFVQKALGDVRFVPLIGEHGWRDDAPVTMAEPTRTHLRSRDVGRSMAGLIREAAEPLPAFDDPAFGKRFDRFADARVVLLGEASHGTSEFYRARDAITRRLVQAHGFKIIAVEADWPDAASIDRHVRSVPGVRDGEPAFQRFPTWMWRNTDVDRFVRWLRQHNHLLADSRRAGFYGLDLYSMNASMRAVIDYLDGVDPEAAHVARTRYGCLTPWSKEPAQYGHMAVTAGYAVCEDAVADMLRMLLLRRMEYTKNDGGRFFDAEQNARVVRDAEAYYRAIYYGSAESWNLRDTHMFQTLQHLLDAGGADSRAVVWAHNSHIGDARHTGMGQQRDELNIGQLCREQFGDQAALIGFGTDSGTVAAASNWDEPMQVMQVNPSMAGSYERLFHEAAVPRCLVDVRAGQHPELRERLSETQLERFIGVIYRPHTERWSHYTEAELPGQFDAYVWFDKTSAVTPLTKEHGSGVPETWPFAL
ncbi:MAG: protein-L-isoaspartate O-methyltransferase [Xanthomonadaceae bacterium]|nr:protein-L-isoaspartate O-methyltransferase [Xanthomonadaceae bacterium]